jgi:hypothetical protein
MEFEAFPAPSHTQAVALLDRDVGVLGLLGVQLQVEFREGDYGSHDAHLAHLSLSQRYPPSLLGQILIRDISHEEAYGYADNTTDCNPTPSASNSTEHPTNITAPTAAATTADTRYSMEYVNWPLGSLELTGSHPA